MRRDDRAVLAIVVAVLAAVAGGEALVWLTTPPPSFEQRFCGFGGGTSAAKPSILLESWPQMGGETVNITQMVPSGRYSAGCYGVDLSLNGTAGTPSRLPAGANGTVTLSVGGTPPHLAGPVTVRWTDPDGDGNLGMGDSFSVTHPGGLPSPGSYTFSILWWDGSTLADVSFRTP